MASLRTDTISKVSASYPYTAKCNGRWSICRAWKVVTGPDVGAVEIEWHPIRWWRLADVRFFVRDQLRVRREF